MPCILLVICLIINSGFAAELTESAAIRLFLEKNLAIQANKYEINIAQAQELTAGLWANPSILADSQLNPFGTKWSSKTAGGPTQQDFILTVPIDVNGKRKQAVRVAKLATRVKEAEFQAQIRDGVFTMLKTLYDVQRLKNEQELLQEKGELMERLVHTLEKRIGNTKAQPLIQSRARLAYEDVKIELEKNKIELTDQINQLKVYLFLEKADVVIPVVNFKGPMKEIFDQKRMAEEARRNRPDFQAIRLLKNQLDEQSTLDHRKIFDDVGLQGGVSNQNGYGRIEGAWSWIIGITIPIPVFDRKQGQIMQTKMLSNQTSIRERFMNETLEREIETSIRKIEFTSANLARYKSVQLTNAKIVRDSALRQFGTGASTLLEFLDAMEAYHSSIQKYIESEYELTTEYLKLKLITGQEIQS